MAHHDKVNSEEPVPIHPAPQISDVELPEVFAKGGLLEGHHGGHSEPKDVADHINDIVAGQRQTNWAQKAPQRIWSLMPWILEEAGKKNWLQFISSSFLSPAQLDNSVTTSFEPHLVPRCPQDVLRRLSVHGTS